MRNLIKPTIFLLVMAISSIHASEKSITCKEKRDSALSKVISIPLYCELDKTSTIPDENIKITQVYYSQTNPNLVKGFKAESMIFKFFPLNLHEKFPKLEAIYIINASLQEIHQHNIKPFHNLYDLDLSKNKLKSIREDLFEGNNRLMRINLRGNLIYCPCPKMFQTLNDLQQLDLTETLCNGHALLLAVGRKSVEKIINGLDNKMCTKDVTTHATRSPYQTTSTTVSQPSYYTKDEVNKIIDQSGKNTSVLMEIINKTHKEDIKKLKETIDELRRNYESVKKENAPTQPAYTKDQIDNHLTYIEFDVKKILNETKRAHEEIKKLNDALDELKSESANFKRQIKADFEEKLKTTKDEWKIEFDILKRELKGEIKQQNGSIKEFTTGKEIKKINETLVALSKRVNEGFSVLLDEETGGSNRTGKSIKEDLKKQFLEHLKSLRDSFDVKINKTSRDINESIKRVSTECQNKWTTLTDKHNGLDKKFNEINKSLISTNGSITNLKVTVANLTTNSTLLERKIIDLQYSLDSTNEDLPFIDERIKSIIKNISESHSEFNQRFQSLPETSELTDSEKQTTSFLMASNITLSVIVVIFMIYSCVRFCCSLKSQSPEPHYDAPKLAHHGVHSTLTTLNGMSEGEINDDQIYADQSDTYQVIPDTSFNIENDYEEVGIIENAVTYTKNGTSGHDYDEPQDDYEEIGFGLDDQNFVENQQDDLYAVVDKSKKSNFGKSKD